MKTVTATAVVSAMLLGVVIVIAGLSTPEATATFETSSGDVQVSLEVADTPGERRIGLMNRSFLPEDHGMLFVFPGEAERAFWMKNTLIPLDMVFIDSNYTVVEIDEADPEPGVPDDELAVYRSDSPAKYVIELNQGFSRDHNITRGTRVSINY